MKHFAELVIKLGTSTKTNDKLDALAKYFASANDADKVWVIAIFSGRRPKRAVSSTLLQAWSNEVTGLPAWLFEESYHTVGDLAETIALLLPKKKGHVSRPEHSLTWYLDKLISIEKESEAIKKDFIIGSWLHMSKEECFVFNKLITGGFSHRRISKTNGECAGKNSKDFPGVIAHRISGNWDPSTTSFERLMNEEGSAIDHSKPLSLLSRLCS
jgi:DNA ligase-1